MIILFSTMKKLSHIAAAGISLLTLLPSFAFAQTRTIGEILRPGFDFFKNDLIGVLVALAVIVIIINIIRYIIHKNDGSNDSKKMGLQLAWSIGGLFVIVSIWGIIAVLQKTIFGNSQNNPPPTVELPL